MRSYSLHAELPVYAVLRSFLAYDIIYPFYSYRIKHSHIAVLLVTSSMCIICYPDMYCMQLFQWPSVPKRIGALSLGAIIENPSIEKLASLCEEKKQKGTGSGNAESHIGYLQRTIQRVSSEMQTWPAVRKPLRNNTAKGRSSLLEALAL